MEKKKKIQKWRTENVGSRSDRLPHAEHIINHKAFRTPENPRKPPGQALEIDELEKGSQGNDYQPSPLSLYTYSEPASERGRLF